MNALHSFTLLTQSVVQEAISAQDERGVLRNPAPTTGDLVSRILEGMRIQPRHRCNIFIQFIKSSTSLLARWPAAVVS